MSDDACELCAMQVEELAGGLLMMICTVCGRYAALPMRVTEEKA